MATPKPVDFVEPALRSENPEPPAFLRTSREKQQDKVLAAIENAITTAPTPKLLPTMYRVIIESPFQGDEQRNLAYVRAACRDSVLMGENPFASHLFYTQFLDDSKTDERKMGIDLGFDMWDGANKIIFYVDYGMSNGMKAALERAIANKKEVVFRYILKNQPQSQPETQEESD